jgi:3-hexulose-6-phosphate synthase
MKLEKQSMSRGDFSRPLLQLALDITTLDEAKIFMQELKDSVDIVEIGTPFILKYGIRPIEEIKRLYPQLPLMADFKIADAGEYESHMAFHAGADIVTVLAAAPDSTIQSVIKQAFKEKKSVMIDTVGIQDIAARVAQIDEMGVSYICAHTGLDEQIKGVSTLENLVQVKNTTQHAKVAVAGGINLSNLERILEKEPDIIIVGAGITSTEDRKSTAAKIREIIGRRRNH